MDVRFSGPNTQRKHAITKKGYFDILKENIPKSVTSLVLGRCRIFQQDRDLKPTSKLVQNLLKDIKIKVLK